MSRIIRALALLTSGALALGLAACASRSAPPTAPPATRLPTQPPVVTRIVPAPPTPTLTPIPTVAYDVEPVIGSWALRIILDITGSPLVAHHGYFGAAHLEVDEHGTISGSGYFTPVLDGGRCVAQTLDSEPLTFHLEGAIVPVGEVLSADLRLVPDNSAQPEAYRVICPDAFGDVRERDAPFLWPVLRGLDLLTWQVVLEVGRTSYLAGDVSASLAEFDGLLSGEITASRG